MVCASNLYSSTPLLKQGVSRSPFLIEAESARYRHRRDEIKRGFSGMLTSLIALTTGFVLTPTPRGLDLIASQPRVLHVLLCVPSDDTKIQEAAARVIEAAKQFGSTQGEVAASWVEEAIAAGDAAKNTSELLQRQMVLFEECLVDDDDGMAKCKELDMALTDLERMTLSGNARAFDSSKFERASARVRTAAVKFGAEQGKMAEIWVEAIRNPEGGAINPAGLLEQQVLLFGECLVDDNAGPARCQALEESLNALQASIGLRGQVVSTSGLMPKPSDKDADEGPLDDSDGPPPPDGFSWGITL